MPLQADHFHLYILKHKNAFCNKHFGPLLTPSSERLHPKGRHGHIRDGGGDGCGGGGTGGEGSEGGSVGVTGGDGNGGVGKGEAGFGGDGGGGTGASGGEAACASDEACMRVKKKKNQVHESG